jgi:hypothetical protein
MKPHEMGKEAHPLKLSGEKTRQNHLDEALAGKMGGKNVGTPKGIVDAAWGSDIKRVEWIALLILPGVLLAWGIIVAIEGFFGLAIGLFAGWIACGLFTWFIGSHNIYLQNWMNFLFGPFWLPAQLSNGLLRSPLLAFWLASRGVFPLKAIPFLEDATARILLRRVGKGYSFTHRLLLDYFADLDLQPPIPLSSRPWSIEL